MDYIRTQTLGMSLFDSTLLKKYQPEGTIKFAEESQFVRRHTHYDASAETHDETLFEKTGPRRKIFFDPAQAKAAIVTCGGLCPGLNNVIRSIFLELHHNYGVTEVLGIRHGYAGLNPDVGRPPIRLTPDFVEDIHTEGGTILGTSRGSQDPKVMVDFLATEGIDMLFCLGGDGTQRGTHEIALESLRRGLKIAVVGIPKTIDNDIAFCDRTFGYSTALSAAEKVIDCAHVESKGSQYGIGLVKVMGREAGFIAAGATLASQEVNFCLIPEIPFSLEGPNGFLPVLRKRLLHRNHAVIVVAEGAGQNLFPDHDGSRDASGNIKFQDIGIYLKNLINDYFKKNGPKVDLKYIDPSYIIRSVPADGEDDILCDQFGRRAVHAAMAGKTDLLIGFLHGTFAHIPLDLAIGKKRFLETDGEIWASVLATTGQPSKFE